MKNSSVLTVRPDYSARSRGALSQAIVNKAFSTIGKAAVSPTTIADAHLSATHVSEYVSSLPCAAADLINAGTVAPLDGIGEIRFPRRSTPIVNVDAYWVEEGMPLPTRQFSLASGAVLAPKKMAAQCILTRELALHSSGAASIQTLIKEDLMFGLDATMFSDADATAAKPAGILFGVAPSTGAVGGLDNAMLLDLERLAGALTNPSSIAYILSTTQANSLRLRRGATFDPNISIWMSAAVSAGMVICVDPTAFISGFLGEPEIRTSTQTAVHMDDTTPLPIGSPGTPNTIAAPVRSLFQTDTLAVKLILRAAWAWRRAGAVSWLTGATWGAPSP
jgi:hypothetical protein